MVNSKIEWSDWKGKTNSTEPKDFPFNLESAI